MRRLLLILALTIGLTVGLVPVASASTVNAAATDAAATATATSTEGACTPGSTSPATDLTRAALGKATAAALKNADVKVLREFLLKQGFQPRVNKAFGVQHEDGTRTLVLPFEGTTTRGAGISIVDHVDGTTTVEAGIFSGGEQGTDLASVEDYKVENGEVVEANSWWSCFWRCLATTCGPGAIGCRWAGPFWWQCTLAVCGGSALICSGVCIGQ